MLKWVWLSSKKACYWGSCFLRVMEVYFCCHLMDNFSFLFFFKTSWYYDLWVVYSLWFIVFHAHVYCLLYKIFQSWGGGCKMFYRSYVVGAICFPQDILTTHTHTHTHTKTHTHTHTHAHICTHTYIHKHPLQHIV